ncbi:hypothetical protein B0H17DRAFT_1142596 [Mycena rosella]|uniref:Uncharacterized protein n=1 Tax=Mycena rosella TaxID=1033263 RepID=A0AAD7G500_MYCRO|nr:hypothetical protein B0H17DRAFT_1142596 [Mycena rosella]
MITLANQNLILSRLSGLSECKRGLGERGLGLGYTTIPYRFLSTNSARMPKQTLEALQEGSYEDASVFFAVADLLDPINLHPDDDDDPESEQLAVRDDSDVAAVLQIYGAVIVEEAESLKGDGPRGPYSQVEKSKDWFTCALNMPDREFRSIFRCVWP